MNLKEATLAEFIRERDAALIALDLVWARRMIAPLYPNPDDLALLASMHKVRYNVATIPAVAMATMLTKGQ